MVRGELTPADPGRSRCVACGAFPKDGVPSLIVRPRSGIGSSHDSLDVVEAIMHLEDRLGIPFPDEACEWDPDVSRDVCRTCEQRYRPVFDWRLV